MVSSFHNPANQMTAAAQEMSSAAGGMQSAAGGMLAALNNINVSVSVNVESANDEIF